MSTGRMLPACVKTLTATSSPVLYNKILSHGMWFPTMWHFDKCTQMSTDSPLLSLGTWNGVQSVAQHS